MDEFHTHPTHSLFGQLYFCFSGLWPILCEQLVEPVFIGGWGIDQVVFDLWVVGFAI